MGKNKKQKIIFFVQHYRPGYEAVSNEVELLANYLEKEGWKVKIHDLHFQNLFLFKFNKRLISYHFAFYPFTLVFVYLYSLFFDIRHIFTSLCDLPYLSIINKKPLLLTAAAPYTPAKLNRRIKNLQKVSLIILENEIQQKHLQQYKTHYRIQKPTKLIYPGVDLVKFNYQKPQNDKFTILFASSPKDPNKFKERGIYLMLEAAKEMAVRGINKINSNVQFDFSWMTAGLYIKSYLKIGNLIERNEITNITLTNGFVKNMNERFAQAHCTIIPYTLSGDFVKLTPNSALESLAAGKPVLCSSKSGIAKIIKENRAGIVFEPNKDSLIRSIEELQKNYHDYQKNCRKTAERLFAKEIFETKYGEIYKQLKKKK